MSADLQIYVAGGSPQPPGFTRRADEDGIARLLLRPNFAPDREAMLCAGFDRFGRLVAWSEVASIRRASFTVTAANWRTLIAHLDLDHMMIAHNRTSGITQPSRADTAFTREAAQFLRAMRIDLVDHLLFAADGHFSFARAGLL